MAGTQQSGAGVWTSVAVATVVAAVLGVVLVVVSHRGDSTAPSAGATTPTPSTTPSSSLTPSLSPSASPSASATTSAAPPPPTAFPAALLSLADVRAVPAADSTAWDGPTGWKAATRSRGTYTCAPHVTGAAAGAYEDTTYAEHRDTLDQEGARFASAADAHTALLALRRELGACATRSALVDLFAGWRVDALADEAQLVDLQVPGQPATFAPGDSAVHLVEVWLVRRGPVLSVLSFAHYDQDQPAPATGFGAALGSALCRAASTTCSPRPALHQIYGDPLPALG